MMIIKIKFEETILALLGVMILIGIFIISLLAIQVWRVTFPKQEESTRWYPSDNETVVCEDGSNLIWVSGQES